MEEDRKIMAVSRVGGVQIVVVKEKNEGCCDLILSKPEATELALDILNTLYRQGEKI